MTAAFAADAAAVPLPVRAVRRWARLNYRAVLVFLSLELVVLVTTETDPAIARFFFLVAFPVLFVLELLLYLSIYRVFRPLHRQLAVAAVGLGLASIVAGVVEIVGDVFGLETTVSIATPIGGALTAASFIGIAAVMRVSDARPGRAWILAVVSAIGFGAGAVDAIIGTDTLILVEALVLVLPWFLYQLSQFALPVQSPTVEA